MRDNERLPTIVVEGVRYRQVFDPQAEGAIKVGEHWYAPDPDQRPERVLDPMPWEWAATAVRDYRCSGCYGHLKYLFAPKKLYYVECIKCGPDTRGFVSKHFVERRRDESQAELWEVRDMLTNAGVIDDPNADKTVHELLMEMGFRS